MNEYQEFEERAREYLLKADLKGDVILEEEAPSVTVMVEKENSCFSSKAMKRQFSNDLMYDDDGGLSGGFMKDYTCLNEMQSQLRVIASIENGLEEYLEASPQRTYLAGKYIYFELMLD